ncbi:MAG: hypothetical protein ACU85E_00675 [Gammaproteobacteria bacterium]
MIKSATAAEQQTEDIDQSEKHICNASRHAVRGWKNIALSNEFLTHLAENLEALLKQVQG